MRFSEIDSLASARRFYWSCQDVARRLAANHQRAASAWLRLYNEGREAQIVACFVVERRPWHEGLQPVCSMLPRCDWCGASVAGKHEPGAMLLCEPCADRAMHADDNPSYRMEV